MESFRSDRIFLSTLQNAGKQKPHSNSEPNPWLLFRNFLSFILFFFSGYSRWQMTFFSPNACSECISNLYIFSYRTPKWLLRNEWGREKFFMSVGRPFPSYNPPLFGSFLFLHLLAFDIDHLLHHLHLSYKWEWKFIC